MIAFKYYLGIFMSFFLIVSGNILKKSHVDNSLDSTTDFATSRCWCKDYSCGCCEWIQIIRGLVCTRFSYLPHDYGISLNITYNNVTLFSETISARNPPPICVGIPELEKISAELCLRFYDLNIENEKFHGCINFKVFFFHLIHKTVELGCFNIPSKIKNMTLNNIIIPENQPKVIIV